MASKVAVVDNEISINLEHIIGNFAPAMQGCLEDGCAKVANEAKKKAPRDTGNLARSIDFDVHVKNKNVVEGIIFSNAEYAPYVEFGTGKYAKKGNGRKSYWRYKDANGWHTTHGHQAQPFLEPAINATKTDVLDSFKEVFGDAMAD